MYDNLDNPSLYILGANLLKRKGLQAARMKNLQDCPEL